MRFRKKVIGAGGYQTPDGAQVVDRARLQHWSDTVRDMRKAGIKPPISWGHAPSAVPHTADDAAFWTSKLVAGEVLDLPLGEDGLLDLHGDAPGVETDGGGRLTTTVELPDGRKVRSAISEVSIGAMDWTDGTGRLWKDAPVHIALTPLPVWVPEGGQPPFEAADGKTTAAHFGAASLLYRFATEEGSAVADETTDDTATEGEGDAAPQVGLAEVIEALASVGLALPESTTDGTLYHDIVVAAAAIKGVGAAGDETPPEPTPPPEPGGGPGAFMSTLRADPIGKQLLAQLEGDARNRRLDRLKAFKRRGLPVNQARDLEGRITSARFGMTAGGDARRAAVDDQLDLIDALLPAEDAEGSFGRTFLATVTGAGVPTPPEGEDAAAEKARDRAVADELARNGGLPARK